MLSRLLSFGCLFALLVSGAFAQDAFAQDAFAQDAFAQEASAQEASADKEYALSNYDVVLDLRPDGTYDVEESITLDIQRGRFSYLMRRIPLNHIDSLTALTVESPDVQIDSVMKQTEGDVVRVQWSYPPRTTPATFHIAYRVHGALRTDGARNVVDWAAVGSGWTVPIRDVDVTVRLPASLDIAREAVTSIPSSAALTSDGGDWEVTFDAGNLPAETGFAVEVAFPQRIEAKKRVSPLHILGSVFLFAVVAAGFLIWKYNRDKVPSVTPPSKPPVLSLPEAARLLSRSRTDRMHPAMLFDLAQRGHLSLEVTSEESWFSSAPTVHIHTHPDHHDLSDDERAFVDELSKHDTLESFSSDATSFRESQRTAIRKRLVERKWLYERRDERWQLGALFLAGLGGVALSVWAGVTYRDAWAFYTGGTAVGALFGALFLIEPRYAPTERGLTKKARLKAFVDDQVARMDALRERNPAEAVRQFPDALPWLMLSGSMTQTWLKRLEQACEDADIANPIPDWLTVRNEDDSFAVFTSCIGPIAAGSGLSASAGAMAGAGAAGAAGGGGGAAG